MKSRIIFTTYLVLLQVLLFGQAASNKNQIPASPEACQLAKFVNYPVGHNTGIPDITIPLYTVNAGEITIPINISYHSGGFKINEQSTNVGLGWSLSTDLQVSRTINGFDDLIENGDYYSGYYYNRFCKYDVSDPNCTYPSIDDYFHLLNNNMDQQPDRFYYKLLGKSGAFYFRKQGNTVEAVPEPYNGVLIKLVNKNSFKIIDTDGTIYWFGNKDNPSDISVIEVSYSIPSENGRAAVTSWKCKNIITPSNNSIHFTYKSKSPQYSSTFQERVEVFDYPNPCQGGDAYSQGSIVYPADIAYHFQQREDVKYEEILDGVLSLGGLLIYNLSTPRFLNYSLGGDAGLFIPYEKKNINGYYGIEKKRYPFTRNYFDNTLGLNGLSPDKITFNGGEITFNGTDQLSSIVVKDNSNNSLQTITFNQSYVNRPSYNPRLYDSDKTWYLDSVEKNGTSPTDKKEKYDFEYFSKYAFTNHMKGSSAWGQTNFSTIDRNELNITTVPWQSVLTTHYRDNRCDGINANTNFILEFGSGDVVAGWQYNNGAGELYAKYGVLKKITYPTGGYTEFEFGPNKYIETKYYSSNRIEIAGGLRIEKIKYYDGVNSTSAFEKIFEYGENNDGAGILKNLPIISPEYYNIIGEYAQPIPQGFKYEQAVQYYIGGWQSNINQEWTWINQVSERKITYTSNCIVDLFYPNGAPVYYKKVTEYQKDMGTQTGKTVFNYYDPLYFSYFPNTLIPGTNLNYEQSSWKLGKMESETDYKYINGNYDWVYQKKYNYTTFKQPDQIWVGQFYQRKLKYFINKDSPTPNLGTVVDGDAVNFSKYYSSGDFQYYYTGIEVGDLLISNTEERWKENGNELSKTTAYTYNNYALVNKTETNNGIGFIQTETTRYPFDINNGVYMSMANSNMLAYPIEKISKRNGMVVGSNLLTYQLVNNQYKPSQQFRLETNTPFSPLTEFNGLTKDVNYGTNPEMTFSGFDNNGNLTMATGRDGIPTSYAWGYNETYPVIKAENIDITNLTSKISLSLIGTGLTLDGLLNSITPLPNTNWDTFNQKLRLNVGSNVMINTYTYKPLVGMMSQTDPNGVTTYYEYDNFGRLKLIRDDDGNILKTYEYNYKQ